MKILCLDDWYDKSRDILKDYELFPTDTWGKREKVVVHHNPVIVPLCHEDRHTFDGLITRLEERFDKELIDYFPNLKFIASGTTGLDHIDVDYAKPKGIEIISLQGETEFLQDVWATAEHTWALILSLIRRVPFAHNDVCVGNWEREKWRGTELVDKTLGVIGYGRVGRQVAHLAHSFGMAAQWYDRKWPKDIVYLAKNGEVWSLASVLERSDIITVHVPLTDETRGMFSYKEFGLMKKGAYFVNTSRGAVVDENALLSALETKKLAGAALDVVAGEPQGPSFQLLEYAKNNTNLVVTPHIGGNTHESRLKTQVYLALKIKEWSDAQKKKV